jgi:two-component system NarL family sensor kinase
LTEPAGFPEPGGLDELVAAEQDERRRLALALHDGPLQDLSAIALMLDAAMYSLEAGNIDDARAVLTTALERQRGTIRELRSLSFALEPVVLRDHGLEPAVQALAAEIEQTHATHVALELGAAASFGPTAQVAMYAVIRELLDQSVRRGPPQRIEIRLENTAEGGVETTVSDDADPERRRGAFERIHERVRRLHGTLRVEAGTETGTRAVVTLPPYAVRR